MELPELLFSLGLVPTPDLEAPRNPLDGDWLPLLERAWRRVRLQGGGPRGRMATSRERWARKAREQGHSLTAIETNEGQARLVWSRKAQGTSCFAIASSHLGKDLRGRRTWFEALRRVCLQERGGNLLSIQQTTFDRFARRAALKFDMSVRRWRLAGEAPGHWRRWTRHLLAGVQEPGELPWLHTSWLSPPLSLSQSSPLQVELAVGEEAAVLRDKLLWAADRLYLLYLRPGGRLEQMFLAGRAGPGLPLPSAVYLAEGPDLVPRRLAENLCGAGGATVFLRQRDLRPSKPIASPSASRGEATSRRQAPLLTWSEFMQQSRLALPPGGSSWPWLSHCTRGRQGRWPGQSEDDFVDELLEGVAHDSGSPLATLQRILAEKKLAACPGSSRNRVPVVCFSALPLEQLCAMRNYRRHRLRWDFEPYGFCMQRRWLIALGARPVIYGDERDWHRLGERDQPFFQLRFSNLGDRPKQTDWSREREWRHVGDVPLPDLSADQAVVFVPSRQEGLQLARHSSWPVVVLEAALLERIKNGGEIRL